jgi:hypothetical protein
MSTTEGWDAPPHGCQLMRHTALSALQNKPQLAWLKKVYGGFERKYRKNLKALYIVHATTFVRTVVMCVKPMISKKFGKKIHFFHQLAELNEAVFVAKLGVPPSVATHDVEVGSFVLFLSACFLYIFTLHPDPTLFFPSVDPNTSVIVLPPLSVIDVGWLSSAHRDATFRLRQRGPRKRRRRARVRLRLRSSTPPLSSLVQGLSR